MFHFSYDQELLKKDKSANMGRNYQQCALSVLDTIADPNIQFDEKGICNYYYQYKKEEENKVFLGKIGEKLITNKIKEIKKEGKNKKYDCIIGLSGGVDSTYLCLFAKKQGLKPLVVHFDNGWNSELAVFNIENTIKKLGFDLYTYVINWEEFKAMQIAYLKASVVDIEVLTDHAFMAVLYEQAKKWKIKYVLAGMNVVTEAILPKYWIYWKGDSINIKDIIKKHGKIPLKNLKTYPFLSYYNKRFCHKVLKMETVSPLNFIDYNYNNIKNTIINELKWRDYGGKHHESVWTRFYQGYILPNKFNIDKRKAHLSNLIFSGQINKSDALKELEKPPYNFSLMNNDYNFVIKKLGFSESEFDEIMKNHRVEHNNFKVQQGFLSKFRNIISFNGSSNK